MEKKTVDVIIPAYRPGEGWKQMLRGLEGQIWPVHRLIVMNTGKENWKAAYEKTTIPMEVHHLTREEFDHGKTRDQAARMSRADYLLFMTQDALPEDCHLIEKLVEAMEQDEKIGAAYARQLPREDCRLMEQYTRQFNYPEESRVKWLADLPELGIKTYFCSNVCAMYRRELYLQLGGFVQKAIFNEDMIFAGELIQKGYGVAYAAEAKVVHSHNYSAIQQFHRNFDLAVSQADHPEVFAGIRSEGEKKRRMALQTGKTMDGDPAGMAERLEISGLSSGKEISEASKVGDPSLYDESEILGISGKVHSFNTIFGYDKQIHKT